MSEPRRICFVSIEAYATLKPGVADLAGGAGFQVVQLGRRLHRLGHAVSYVVGDFGQPRREEIDGLVAHRASRVHGGGRQTRGPANVLRIWRAMRAARADTYVQRSNCTLAFFVLLCARLLGARYVFMVANLPHVSQEGLAAMPRLQRALYAWTLRRADLVTVQSRDQERLLRENLGLAGVLVPNGIAVPPLPEAPVAPTHDLVWACSVKPSKRPDRLLEIARALPGRTFLVAGGPGADRAYYERMVAAFAEQPNVTYAGFVPPDQVGDFYRRGRLFLLTSDYEGFPNTFLHAWAAGVPVCSLDIDPDGVVARQQLGVVDPDPGRLAARIDGLLEDAATYEAMRRRCHDHVRREHSLERLEAAFLAALPGKAR